ncbi:MAG: MFS transporter [Anaerolineales bacterium]|nr:MAG: MFS transporter [Anaerolineales bacterium]
MSMFRDRTFTATGLAHLSVDILNSQVAILLAFLSGPLHLTNALIGIVSTLYSLGGSLSQPLFGWISDRRSAKPFAVGGVVWMAACFAIALFTPGRWALVVLIIGALGSAAFHPVGAAEATRRGQYHLAKMETTAASIFFFFGQGGLFLGPLVGGPLLDRWGKPGLLLLFLVVLPSTIYLQHVWRPEPRPSQNTPGSGTGLRMAWLASPGIGVFILFIFLRSWTQMSVSAFLPKHISDLGYHPNVFGPIAGLFMGGSAIGGVAGGWLADRFGNRIVAFWTLILAIFPLGGLAFAHEPITFAILSFWAGALIGASHSIIIVLAQRMLPGQMGAASGLVLRFTFASGSIGNLVSGLIADWLDLPRLFLLLACLCSTSALLALTLKRKTAPQIVQV